MTKRMLIDAAHAEETRVVVVDGRRIEELDFESQSLKQLRGNIYLAKVIRVEPSLQAAFVEYGGNRHGFLAFNEIHPDYYQIPVADRQALLREEAEETERDRKRERPVSAEGDGEDAESSASSDDDDDDDDVMDEELERRRRRLMRRYKIQEVIRRRQIMLVQVVKEERGNKGAALTTYLSLAGRYGVLMPNTARGGGISRKITTATDRKRLKTVVQGLDVPHGMGLIIRTAGAKRTKAEIKRDYEYLLRMWENIRETTLKSIAPALIYEEEDLVKRAIRDMYDKELDGIWVEGEAGYKEARDFMRMIMPSQARKIQPYREPTPLFVAAGIEDQISQIHSPVVPLKSGGYLVINQTEALVAIDVNSGKSTRERNVEATALKTNTEAAEEAARQLRLRDLAGLIVIDFIDMDESKNNRHVEKVLKDCLRDDRARIQMGKISSFGLMEISRQRRRSGILEGTTHLCPHCQGAGRVRSTESSALAALRAIELEGAKTGGGAVIVRLPTTVALYILNEKRSYLAHIEEVHGLKVAIAVDEAMSESALHIERTLTREEDPDRPVRPVIPASKLFTLPPEAAGADPDDEDGDADDEEIVRADNVIEVDTESTVETLDEEPDREEAQGEDGRANGRRRRRRRGGRREEGEALPREADSDPTAPETAEAAVEAPQRVREFGRDEPLSEDEAARGRRRRRGRRGGRRMREEGGEADVYAWSSAHGETPHVEGEDPYVWRDAAAPSVVRTAPEPETFETQTSEPMTEASAQAPTPASTPEGEEIYAWVEDAAPPPPREPRTRRPRSRSRGGRGKDREQGLDEAVATAGAGDAVVEPPADQPIASLEDVGDTPADTAEAALGAPVSALYEPEAEPVAETVATPEEAYVEAPVEASEPAPVAFAEPEPTPEPEAAAVAPETALVSEPTLAAVSAPHLEPEPEPVTAAEPTVRVPDPAEVAGPPAAPRRGWWRLRG